MLIPSAFNQGLKGVEEKMLKNRNYHHLSRAGCSRTDFVRLRDLSGREPTQNDQPPAFHLLSEVPTQKKRKLPSAKPEHDSGTEPEIVLAVIQPVRDFCHEVLGLYWANGEVLGHFEINAAACCHCKIVFGPR